MEIFVCRIALFSHSGVEGDCAMAAFRKSDRRAAQSLAAVLHLDNYTDDDIQGLVEEYALDVNSIN